MERLEFRALGCPCQLLAEASSNSERTHIQSAFRQVVEWVSDYESRYSRFIEQSELSRLNRGAGTGWQSVDADMSDMLDLCDWAYFQSRRCLDVTAAPLVKLYYRAQRAPDLVEIAQMLPFVGWDRIQRRPGAVYLPEGMSLDFGGFGKEHAVDLAATLLEMSGLTTYLVNFGNDIRVRGVPNQAPGWVIGMEDPTDTSQMVKRLIRTEGGVAASGNYRRKVTIAGKDYGHIVDPRTGRPAKTEVVAVHVTAPSALQAGVLATAAVILGLEKGMDLVETCVGAEAFFICEQTTKKTKGLICYDP